MSSMTHFTLRWHYMVIITPRKRYYIIEGNSMTPLAVDGVRIRYDMNKQKAPSRTDNPETI